MLPGLRSFVASKEATLQQFYNYGIPPEMEKKWAKWADNEWSAVTRTPEDKKITFSFAIKPTANEAVLNQVSVNGKKVLVYEEDRFF